MAAACALLAACGGGEPDAQSLQAEPEQGALSAGALGETLDLATGEEGALAMDPAVVEAFWNDENPAVEVMRTAMRVLPTPAAATTAAAPAETEAAAAPASTTASSTSSTLATVTAPSTVTTTSTRTTTVIRMSDLQYVTATAPNLSALPVFTAQPPYYVQTKDGLKRVKLGIYGTGDDLPRRFDFVAPIINPSTNRTNALTLQTPVQTSTGMKFMNVSDGSSPKASNLIPGRRIDYANGELSVAYRAGDPPSSEKCRVMINSWPVPTRATLTWDLSFKLGDSLNPWPVTKPTVSPTLLWQLKADPGYPSMGFFVDTSPENIANIQLTFFQRTQNVWENDLRWVIPDLKRGSQVDMTIQAVLDDRSDPYSSGRLKVWLNGRLIIDRAGRNLIQNLPDVHRWAFGVYMMSESYPVSQSRVTAWKRARMLIGGPI